jgi:hypothetical protein
MKGVAMAWSFVPIIISEESVCHQKVYSSSLENSDLSK